jgi:hypothetical protein
MNLIVKDHCSRGRKNYKRQSQKYFLEDGDLENVARRKEVTKNSRKRLGI